MKLFHKKNNLIFLFIFFLNAISGQGTSIVGKWSIDIQKTVSANPKISEKQKETLEYYSNRISLEFFNSGEFSERIGYDYFIEGTWSRYKDDLVVVRCEGDSQIKSTKENLLQKIDYAQNDPRKRIRLKQNLYRLNRFAIRSYYQEGKTIHSNHNFGGYELNLVFKK